MGRLGEIDRDTCRLAAVERFSIERMARDHERLYQRMVERGRARAVTTLELQAGRRRAAG